MGYKKKTWQEKLVDKQDLPKILTLEKRFPCYNAVHKMGANEGDKIVLINPGEVIGYMQSVPEGKLTTIVEICKAVADSHQVAGCCSLTTGIFIMTAANAAAEALAEGKSLNIPYWRTLKADGYLNEKYPGGLDGHKRLLEKEGFNIATKGKRMYVEDFGNFVFTF
jgi:alkylated DNA nucleotide flippase Atl1